MHGVDQLMHYIFHLYTHDVYMYEKILMGNYVTKLLCAFANILAPDAAIIILSLWSTT